MLAIKTSEIEGTYKDYKHTNMPMFICGDLDYRKQSFYNFCDAWDKRENKWLQQQPHVFSHRLHWHELPVFEELNKYRAKHDLVSALHLCLLYCFTVENNKLFGHLKDLSTNEFGDFISDYKEPLQRMDLFQLWLPSNNLDVMGKGILRQILIRDLPVIAQRFHDELRKQNSVMGMMPAKDLLVSIVQDVSGWKRCSYACKNAVRHVAMAFNELVDPESYVRPGTGSYQGFQQVFGGKFLMSKPDEAIQEQFKILADDERADKLFYAQKWLNIEDKICFFFKWLGFESGFRTPPRPPKNPDMVFPPHPFTFKKDNNEINKNCLQRIEGETAGSL